MLIEITDSTTARVTVQANRRSFFNETPTPRGAPPTSIPAVTTSTRPLTRQDFIAILDHMDDKPTLDVSHPGLTIAAVAHVIADHAVIGRIRNRSDRITATLRFAHLGPTMRFEPAAVVRALNRGGVDPNAPIWVGVCIASAHGEWVSATDAFDLHRGCAGWVPDRRAHSIGVLHAESTIPIEAWMTALLGLATVFLVTICIVRVRVGPLHRVRKLWLGSLAILAVTITADVILITLARATSELHDVFGTTLENSTHQLAVSGALYGGLLAIAALFMTLWTFSQPATVS